MDAAEFKKQSLALCQWAAGNLKESAPVFFVNNYLGHSISFEDGVLEIQEGDNGSLNNGSELGHIELTADQVDEMYFSEDEYKFMIFTKEDDEDHNGQGYDIEVYQLERIEFPKVTA